MVVVLRYRSLASKITSAVWRWFFPGCFTMDQVIVSMNVWLLQELESTVVLLYSEGKSVHT